MIVFSDSLTPEQIEAVKYYLEGVLSEKMSATYIGASLTFGIGDVTYICHLRHREDREMRGAVDPEIFYLTAKCYQKFKNENCSFWVTSRQIVQDYEEEAEGFLK